MRSSIFAFFAACLFMTTGAQANWEYSNRDSNRDSWKGDDGMRFVLSVRGGASYGRAKIKNEIGGLTGNYMFDNYKNEFVTQSYATAVCANDSSCISSRFDAAGYGRLGDLPAAKNYSEMAVAVGISAGFTMPDTPQWRIEFGLDHISEVDYNQNPLFEGDLVLQPEGVHSVEAQSGGVQSSLATDVYGVMFFYDFFDGVKKPVKTMIPYIGIGAGYSDSKTILQLTDSYGDLSDVYELQEYGIIDENGIIKFNKAETHSANLVPMAALGFSYGMSDRMFLDAGVRAMYIPQIKWQLTSVEAGSSSTSASERRRDWFTAENMIYLNAMIGLRVEF